MKRVALIQLVSSADVQKNLDQLPSLFEQAVAEGASLVVLPENFAFMGYHETDKLAIAERAGDGPIQAYVSHLAMHYKLWVIAGTIPIQSRGERVKATSLVYNDFGQVIASYDKIHLFDVDIPGGESHRESHTIEAGYRLTVVDTPVGSIGLSVCYDVRFPELYRALALQGAELFTLVSAFTDKTGEAHWASLLRARAIENLCYVLAPNQGGLHENQRKTYGHSMIINPWGKVLAEANIGPQVIVADINLEELHVLRQNFPCHLHHKMA